MLTVEQREAIYRWRRRRGQYFLDDYHLDDDLDEQSPRRVDIISHREQHAAGGLVVIDPAPLSELEMSAIVALDGVYRRSRRRLHPRTRRKKP
jgi:hypothetical protein